MQEIRFSPFAATFLGIMLVTMWGVPALGQDFHVEAGYSHWWLSDVTASKTLPTDSVANDAIRIGQLRWNISMFNQLSVTLNHPSITALTALDLSCFEGGVVPTQKQAATLEPSGALGWEISLSMVDPNPCTDLRRFTPGVDVERTVSPLVIPPGGGQQTVTIKVTTRDPSRYSTGSGIGIWVFADKVLSFPCPSDLTGGGRVAGAADPQTVPGSPP